MDLTTTPPLAPPRTPSAGDDQVYRILAGGQEEDGQEDHEPTGFLGGPVVRSPHLPGQWHRNTLPSNHTPTPVSSYQPALTYTLARLHPPPSTAGLLVCWTTAAGLSHIMMMTASDQVVAHDPTQKTISLTDASGPKIDQTNVDRVTYICADGGKGAHASSKVHLSTTQPIMVHTQTHQNLYSCNPHAPDTATVLPRTDNLHHHPRHSHADVRHPCQDKRFRGGSHAGPQERIFPHNLELPGAFFRRQYELTESSVF